MESKQPTPLGYLMGLLDVSLRDLSDYLYVAQTTISKWKTGARALRPSSQHFAGVVEYFVMLARDLNRRQKMVALFSRLYPDENLDTPEHFAQCLRAFLDATSQAAAEAEYALSESGRLYTAQIGIYSGEQGVLMALDHLARLARAHPLSTISISGTLNPLAFKTFPSFLMENTQIRLLTDITSACLTDGATVLSHPSVAVRMDDRGMALPPYEAYYALQDGPCLSLLQIPGEAPYAAMMTDPESVRQRYLVFNAAFESAQDVFADAAIDALLPNGLHLALEGTLPERIDLQLPCLPYLTMHESLLMEVLRTNGITGRIWTQALALRSMLATIPVRLFLPAGTLGQKQTALPLLSKLCGKQVMLSQEQARRHLLDTAALLRAEKGLTILPLATDINAQGTPLLFVRRNAFAGYLDIPGKRVRHTRHPLLVPAFAEAMEILAASVFPEAKDMAYIAALLEQAALSG